MFGRFGIQGTLRPSWVRRRTGFGESSPKLLSRLIHDLRGPEAAISGMSDQELAGLLDALYRNLDTPCPELDAAAWYDVAVEESLRRADQQLPEHLG